MKSQELTLTSDTLIVTDPGYYLDTAAMDGLGAIVAPCRPGAWSVTFATERPPHRHRDIPHVLIAAHVNAEALSTDQWLPRATELGGDFGMIGIFDRAHFHDSSLVPANQQWTFDGEPADASDLWYSWVCEHARTADCALFPHGVVVNWDLGTSLDVAFDASGLVTALRLTFHDIQPDAPAA